MHDGCPIAKQRRPGVMHALPLQVPDHQLHRNLGHAVHNGTRPHISLHAALAVGPRCRTRRAKSCRVKGCGWMRGWICW